MAALKSTWLSRTAARWQIPGGSVAVVKDGRLVMAHGYGFADRDNRRPVQPASLARPHVPRVPRFTHLSLDEESVH